jgi:4-oxalocrotonate tautomerase
MPLVTIDLLEGRTEGELDAISDAVHQTMVECLEVPERDRFQIVTQHQPQTLRFDRRYLDIDRSERFVLVRVTLAAGRAAAVKQAFYRRLSQVLSDRTGLRADDLTVILVENNREDWSFGRGQANYLELPPAAWR